MVYSGEGVRYWINKRGAQWALLGRWKSTRKKVYRQQKAASKQWLLNQNPGWGLSERGLLDENKTVVVSETEEDIFEHMGIPFILPGKREKGAFEKIIKTLTHTRRIMNLKILQDSREASKYAFLMVKYEMPEFIKRLQEQIPVGDLFKGDGYRQGLETESHITLLPCLSNDTDLLKLISAIPKVEELKAELVNVSIFQQQDCDVLKADVEQGSLLNRINEALVKDFKSFSEFEYHPHMTIAYLKKDSASSINLTRTLEKPVKVVPLGYLYSFYSGNDEKQIMFDFSGK